MNKQIAMCRNCGEFYGKIGEETGGVRLIAPERIGGIGHPARGIVLSKGYMKCRCGWISPSYKTESEIIEAWNKLMY